MRDWQLGFSTDTSGVKLRLKLLVLCRHKDMKQQMETTDFLGFN